jgi:hypothetical protein
VTACCCNVSADRSDSSLTWAVDFNVDFAVCLLRSALRAGRDVEHQTTDAAQKALFVGA